MSKQKILVKNPPLHFPEVLKTNGKVYLDLNASEQDLRLFRNTQNLSVSNNGIQRDNTALGQSLPCTKRNEAVLNSQVDTKIFNNEYEPLEVCTIVGHKVLDQDLLCINSKDLATRQYDTLLTKSNRDSLEGLADCRICDLDLGTFEFTDVNLQVNWNTSSFSGTDTNVYFPLVDYGNWVLGDTVSCEDFRPFISAYHVLSSAFKKNSWRFKSPFLESEYGRRIFLYLLDKDWYDYSNQGVNIFTHVEISSDLIVSGSIVAILFDSIVSDTGGNWSPALPVPSYVFNDSIPSTVEACLEMEICIDTNVDRAEITVELVQNNVGNIAVQNFVFEDGNVGCANFVIEQKAEMVQNEIIFVRVFANTEDTTTGQQADLDFTIKTGASLKIKPCDKRIYKGDNLPLSEMMRCDCTALDILTGLSQMVNFQLTINPCTRTVCLDIPETFTTNFQEVIPSFFKDSFRGVINLDDKIKPNSAILSSPKNNTFSGCKFGFADSTDKYIESLALPEDEELFCREYRTTDNSIVNEPEDKRNTKFEPTKDRQAEEINNFNNSVSIPAMWDNITDDGEPREISHCIEPRIVWAVGSVEQFVNNSNIPSTWSFNNTDETFLPYASQCTEVETSNTLYANLTFEEKPNTISLIDIGWKTTLLNLFYSSTIEALIYLNLEEFCSFDFSATYSANIDGNYCSFRVKEIRDFIPCRKLSTPIVLQTLPHGRKLPPSL